MIKAIHLLLLKLWVKQAEAAAVKNKGGEKGVQKLLEGQRYFLFTKIPLYKYGQPILKALVFQAAACTAHFPLGKDYLKVFCGADLVQFCVTSGSTTRTNLSALQRRGTRGACMCSSLSPSGTITQSTGFTPAQPL